MWCATTRTARPFNLTARALGAAPPGVVRMPNTGSKHKRGTEQHNAKLDPEKVRLIRALYVPNDREFSYMALARRFGVSNVAIFKLIQRQTWDHVE
jgi:hypothetical protein